MVELRLERVMYLVGEKTTTDPQEIQAVAEGLRSVLSDSAIFQQSISVGL